MRRAALLAILCLLLATTACGNDSSGGKVLLQVITPVGKPTEVPVAERTPLPPPEVILSAEAVYQAGALLVSVTGEITSGSVTALGRTLPLSKGAQSLYTFVPVDTEAPAGIQPLRIDFTTRNGSTGTVEESFEVLATEWTQDYLEFTEDEVTNLLDPAVTEQELAMLRTTYSKVTPEKLWEGPWLIPVDAVVTGRFGEQRSINGGPMSGHHSGTDFGASLGTPVLATNSGLVVLSRQLTVRGNTVVVDHGGGLFSAYSHLDSLTVAEGQLVATGQEVGLSGNTGLSTAPHLHWEIAQSGVLLDALRFSDGSNGF